MTGGGFREVLLHNRLPYSQMKAYDMNRGMKLTTEDMMNIQGLVDCDSESEVRIRTPFGGG